MSFKKIASTAAIAVAATLVVPVSPAVASSSSASSVVLSAREDRPVQNRAGVKELVKASTLLKSSIRAMEAIIVVNEKIAALEESGGSSAAIERLDRRRDLLFAKAIAARDSAQLYAAVAEDIHDERRQKIESSGRTPVDAPTWTAARLAFEATSIMFEGLNDVSDIADGPVIVAD